MTIHVTAYTKSIDLMIFDIQVTLLTNQKYIVNKYVLSVYGDQQMLRSDTLGFHLKCQIYPQNHVREVCLASMTVLYRDIYLYPNLNTI